MISYENFYDYVLPDVIGCSADAAKLAIRSASVKFFAESLIYQIDETPQTTVDGNNEYFVDSYGSYIPHKVLEVRLDGNLIRPISVTDAARTYGDWRTKTSTPTRYLQDNPNTIKLIPVPDKAYSLTMRVAMKPSRTSAGVETFVYNDYAEVIAAGAKSILMSSPKKPYTDPQGAVQNEAQFVVGINSARQRANRSFVSSDLRVSIPRI